MGDGGSDFFFDFTYPIIPGLPRQLNDLYLLSFELSFGLACTSAISCTSAVIQLRPAGAAFVGTEHCDI